jgi:hypothetical protein
MIETKRKSHMTAKNPGVYLGLLLICLWTLCWAVFMGFFRKTVWNGVPAVTWSVIAFGILAIIVSVIAIPLFNNFENN